MMNAMPPISRQAAPHRRHALVDQTISEHAAAQAAQRFDRLTRVGPPTKVMGWMPPPDGIEVCHAGDVHC
jgi:hypothetical protein